MLITKLLLWLFIATTGIDTHQTKAMTAEETKLFSSINAYRKARGLKAIPVSGSLTTVARIHALDLKNHPPKEPCNMHSWSAAGKWAPCCYTPDHKNAGCMWLKPEELTGYPAHGYEISAFNTASGEINWLQQWKESAGHNEVITNQGIWKNVEWKAMGLAIRAPYAVVWFGAMEDKAPENE